MVESRAPRNRTLVLEKDEEELYSKRLLRLKHSVSSDVVLGHTICQEVLDALPYLPTAWVDLLVLDPPYNLTKEFRSNTFSKTTVSKYEDWFQAQLEPMLPLLTSRASLYVCGDWHSSSAIHRVCERYLKVRNRITWEREKGRGAKANWKNCSEDIWFCTVSDDYTFNIEDVKLKRKVVAPYTDEAGAPKDWADGENGKYRVTHPSNLWTDISVPFWSMPENTEHPTQKPEKLIAKLILASSKPGDVVFDPFLGSGTTSVVSKKLGRRYVGVEVDEHYCCLAEKRLKLAEKKPSIQGYSGGTFWERNTLAAQKRN